MDSADRRSSITPYPNWIAYGVAREVENSIYLAIDQYTYHDTTLNSNDLQEIFERVIPTVWATVEAQCIAYENKKAYNPSNA